MLAIPCFYLLYFRWCSISEPVLGQILLSALPAWRLSCLLLVPMSWLSSQIPGIFPLNRGLHFPFSSHLDLDLDLDPRSSSLNAMQ